MEHYSISKRNVPRETFLKAEKSFEKHASLLNSYIDQLLWWTERINLVSRNVPRETIRNHVLHSILLSQLDIFKSAEFIVDTGTGGGLPGLPLAIVTSGKSFLLNDIVSKKVLAVKQMARKLNLPNVTIFDSSVAELAIDRPFLLISKHAFKINTLFQLTKTLPWTDMVFYKGHDFEDELNGIDTSLSVKIFNLSEQSENDFYKDKVLVIVSR